ncbi:MAG: bifunctional oligoribonuclease/PAP phosphatase NrnA [Acholeplasmatales bacterium]|nr:bifunctional oligoribonuclease/PAP phosphatase NrnA [Acholeplasmatales bacterium]
MEKILELIKKYNRIIIFGHVRPDGDCIGSQFGLYEIIRNSFPDKEIYISGETSKFVSFIAKPSFVSDDLIKGSLAIVVDVANGERTSDQRFKDCDYILKIDHHPTIDNFGDYNYVDDKAPACTQIIAEFYFKYQNELKINKAAATALYVGIYTDTGRFKYDSVKSKTFITAAKLLDLGVDLTYVDNNLSVEPINALKLRGYCLSNFNITENGFAYLVITRDIIEKYGVTDEDAASQVTTISTIDVCPVWALIIEYPTEIRIRLRSRGPIINEIAAKYQGGGHPKAAGAHLDSFADLDDFVKDMDNFVKNYKETLA